MSSTVRIYTRTGDDGTTSLLGGQRVAKDAERLEAYGTVDELNAVLGWGRAALATGQLDAALGRIQGELFLLGAELATPLDAPPRTAPQRIGAPHIDRLEQDIDEWESRLTPLRNFILPAGSSGAAALHVARTVCRRAERRVQTLSRIEPVRAEVIQYLNRLSDHLFVAARTANLEAGADDVIWRQPQ